MSYNIVLVCRCKTVTEHKVSIRYLLIEGGNVVASEMFVLSLATGHRHTDNADTIMIGPLTRSPAVCCLDMVCIFLEVESSQIYGLSCRLSVILISDNRR